MCVCVRDASGWEMYILPPSFPFLFDSRNGDRDYILWTRESEFELGLGLLVRCLKAKKGLVVVGDVCKNTRMNPFLSLLFKLLPLLSPPLQVSSRAWNTS